MPRINQAELYGLLLHTLALRASAAARLVGRRRTRSISQMGMPDGELELS